LRVFRDTAPLFGHRTCDTSARSAEHVLHRPVLGPGDLRGRAQNRPFFPCCPRTAALARILLSFVLSFSSIIRAYVCHFHRNRPRVDREHPFRDGLSEIFFSNLEGFRPSRHPWLLEYFCSCGVFPDARGAAASCTLR